MVRVIIELAERDFNLIRLLADELVLTPSAVLSRLLREGIEHGDTVKLAELEREQRAERNSATRSESSGDAPTG